MGYKLADKIRQLLGEEGIKEIDAVIPIPETANTSAASVAESLGKPYSQGEYTLSFTTHLFKCTD